MKGRLLIGLAILFVPAAFVWTIMPFHSIFGWSEFEFRARLLQKAAVSFLGFATLCVAAWVFYSGHFILKQDRIRNISDKSKKKDAQPGV